MDSDNEPGILLEHQYSPAALSFSALKGADAARARVLAQAAARAQCAAHLGIVHIGESGLAEPEDAFYGSHWNRYRDYDGGDEEDAEEEEGFTAASVDDAWQYVDEGATGMIAPSSLAAFLWAAASCSQPARSTGSLQTKSG